MRRVPLIAILDISGARGYRAGMRKELLLALFLAPFVKVLLEDVFAYVRRQLLLRKQVRGHTGTNTNP
jgi:hypothetical protein